MHVPSSMLAMFVFLLCVRRKIIGEQLIFTIEQEQKGVKKKIVSDRSRPEMNSLLRIVSTIGDVRICFCLHFSSRQVTVIADRTDGSCCCSNKTHSHIFRGTAAYTFSPSPQYPCIDSCKTLWNKSQFASTRNSDQRIFDSLTHSHHRFASTRQNHFRLNISNFNAIVMHAPHPWASNVYGSNVSQCGTRGALRACIIGIYYFLQEKWIIKFIEKLL